MPEVPTTTEAAPVVKAKKTGKKLAKKAAKKPAAKKADKGGLTVRKSDTLSALKSGKSLTHEAIAKVTGREKGNMLRELIADKLVVSSVEDGVRGFLYTITAKGKAELAKSK